ncbi:MAG: hypothetical protein NXI00_23150 [Cytophagales bacterium]|nr:hypothetical protein [Cytophagales bacterium]
MTTRIVEDDSEQPAGASSIELDIIESTEDTNENVGSKAESSSEEESNSCESSPVASDDASESKSTEINVTS